MTSHDDQMMRDVLRRVDRPVDLDDAAAARVLDRALQRYEEHRRPHTGDDESPQAQPLTHSHATDRTRRSMLMIAASFVIVLGFGAVTFSLTGRETDEAQVPLDTVTATTSDLDSPTVETTMPAEPGVPENVTNPTAASGTTDAADWSDVPEVPANPLGLAAFTTRRLASGVVDGDLSYATRTVGTTTGSGGSTELDVRFAAGTAANPADAPYPIRTVTIESDGTVEIPLDMLYPPAFGGPCEGGSVPITLALAIDSIVEASCAGASTDVRVASTIGEPQTVDGVTATPITYEITVDGLDPDRVTWWFGADRLIQMTYTIDGMDVDLD